MNPFHLCRIATNLLITRRYPVSLVHFVTDRCNARCPHCFIDFAALQSPQADLSCAEIDRATRHMGPCLSNVNLTGGEPFLREDLEEIARLYLRNAGVSSVYVTSNGSLPDRVRRFGRALAAEFPDRTITLSFSLDHFERRHDEIRQVKGLFASVLESYRGLQDLAPRVMATIAITVTEDNHEIVLDLYRHLRDDLGIRSVTAGPVRDQGRYRTPPGKRRAIMESTFDLQRTILRDMQAGRLAGYDRASLVGRLLNRKNEIASRWLRRAMPSDRFIARCFAGAMFGVIRADGVVGLCEMLDEPLGALRDAEYDLMKLWAAPAAGALRRRIARTKCHCLYDCAWTVNILARWRHQPGFLLAAMPPARGGRT